MGVFMQFKKQGVGGAAVDSVHVMFSAVGSTQHANQSGGKAVKCQLCAIPSHLCSKQHGKIILGESLFCTLDPTIYDFSSS